VIDYSIFCVPMKFEGVMGIRQENALQSWKALQYPPESIAFVCDDEGVPEYAEENEYTYIPGLERNEFGTPLVSSFFSLAQKNLTSPHIAYVNSDIMLIGFGDALQMCIKEFDKFLMIGRRHDLDVTEPIDFEKNWQFSLSQDVRRGGQLHAPGAIDFFAFPRGMYKDIPPFAIGRSAWDNWLVIWARNRYIPVIDSTELVYIVHQNMPESGGNEVTDERNEERRRNRVYYDRDRGEFSGSVKDANYAIVGKRIRKR